MIKLKDLFSIEKQFLIKSIPKEYAKFRGLTSLENYVSISELPISNPRFILLLNVFSKHDKSLSIILKPCPAKGCTTCKASPNRRILSW